MAVILEKSAVEKICPFAKVGGSLFEKCEGKKCMAWEWSNIGDGKTYGFCQLIERGE